MVDLDAPTFSGMGQSERVGISGLACQHRVSMRQSSDAHRAWRPASSGTKGDCVK
jgi:hypothetical protein